MYIMVIVCSLTCLSVNIKSMNAFCMLFLITQKMEALYHYFKVQLPGYLKSLPLPKSFSGFTSLTRSQWLHLLPFFIFVFIFLYLLVSPFLKPLLQGKKPRPHVNKKIKKDEKKVVNTFDIEDIGDKKAFCRCWKSSKASTCV